MFALTARLTYDYELIVVPGLDMNHSMVPTLKKVIKKPPTWIHPTELGGEDAAGKTFTISVRLKTSDVRNIQWAEFVPKYLDRWL